MTNSQRQSMARRCFLHWIGEQGGSESALAPQNDLRKETDVSNQDLILREGMVIREDYFLGRRFVTESFNAIWFIEEDQLKIFDDSGKVLQVMQREEINQYAAAYDAALTKSESTHIEQEILKPSDSVGEPSHLRDAA